MTKEEKKLIELLEHTVNEKAVSATRLMYSVDTQKKKDFYHGQYMAFNELYSMLQNIKSTL